MPTKKKIQLKKRQIMRLYHSGIHSIRGIAFRLNASTKDGKKFIRGIIESSGHRVRRRLWSRKEIKQLRKLYPDYDAKIVAQKLNRSISSIFGEAHKLKIKKSNQWREKERRRQARTLIKAGKPFRFKEGQIVWNEGMKGLKIPGSKKGQFKKENYSKRWKGYYNGKITLRREGNGRLVKVIRLAPGKWEYYHRYLWMKKHGSIPRGKIIAFKNFDSLDCRLSNLIMINRKQNGARWSLSNGGVAKCLARQRGGRGKLDQRLFNEFMKHPKLLEVKRRQLELQRSINAQR